MAAHRCIMMEIKHFGTRCGDIDSKDDYYDTPMSFAAFGGHEAVVKLLLGTGRR